MAAQIPPAEAPEWVAAQLAGLGGTRWIGIDGFGAAGKTTVAAAIAARVPGSVVVHVDDFGRVGVRGWDRDLFVDQVLDPLLAGRPGRYQTWDLVADCPLEWVEVPAGRPVVVEGVSATDERVPVPWDLTLWVATPAALRRRRILAREEPELLERWRDDWIPSERAYGAEQRPWVRVDAIVATTRSCLGREAESGRPTPGRVR